MRSLFILAVLTFASGTASAGEFALFFKDAYVDQYDSRQAVFKRLSCREQDDIAAFSLGKAAIKRLKRRIRQVHFFKLPDSISQNSDGETLTVCGPCPDSRLTIDLGRGPKTIDWDCDCKHDSDPPELAPLLKELREILYGVPAIAQLPASSCRFY